MFLLPDGSESTEVTSAGASSAWTASIWAASKVSGSIDGVDTSGWEDTCFVSDGSLMEATEEQRGKT